MRLVECVLPALAALSNVGRRTYAQARERQQMLERIADRSPDVVYIYDFINHQLAYVNDQASSVLGYRAEQLLALDGDAAVALLHPAGTSGHTEARQRYDLLDDGEILEHEFSVRVPGIGDRWLQGRCVIFARTPEGHARQVLGVVRDVSQRHELEQAQSIDLSATMRALGSAERMATLGTLAAGLTHDIANLLLPIRCRLESLRKKRSVAREQDDNLQTLSDVVAHLSQLTNSVRQLVRDIDGASASESTQVQAWWLTAARVLRLALPSHVALKNDFPSQPLTVNVAEHLLTQAAFNLVHNAGNSMQHIGNCVTVWADAAIDSGFHRLGVRDNGPGMTQEVKRRCLEPFYTTNPNERSIGLGLAIVHLIMRRAGGTIQIESEPGHGTNFILVLRTS